MAVGLLVLGSACVSVYRPHPPLQQKGATVCLVPQFDPREPYRALKFFSGTFVGTTDCPRCNQVMMNAVVEEIQSLGFGAETVQPGTRASPSCTYVMTFRPRVLRAENDDPRCRFLAKIGFEPLKVEETSGSRRVVFEKDSIAGDKVGVDGCVVDMWHSIHPEELASEQSQNIIEKAVHAGTRRTTEEVLTETLGLGK
jgi:hypothetical protein